MFVKVEEKNELFSIRLNRPDVRNAFHPEMIQQLTEAFAKATHSKARAVFLTGEGPSFCAGADLEWMKSMKNFSLQENAKDSEKLFTMFETARNCLLPIVCRIQGHVMGGATGLVAVSDLVAAESTTRFCFSEVKLGLAPAVISPFILRKMNMSQARELMLTARIFSAEEAQVGGLINFQGSPQEVDQYLRSQLQLIFASGPEAVRATKQLINTVTQPLLNGLKEQTAKVIAERRVSHEGQEGLRAFFDKDTPRWKKDFDGPDSI